MDDSVRSYLDAELAKYTFNNLPSVLTDLSEQKTEKSLTVEQIKKIPGWGIGKIQDSQRLA